MIDAHNRCDQAGENGITRLAGVRCPQGLAFDIDRQTCDWKTRVKNCDKLDSKYDEGRKSWSTGFKRYTHHVMYYCYERKKKDNYIQLARVLIFKSAASRSTRPCFTSYHEDITT